MREVHDAKVAIITLKNALLVHEVAVGTLRTALRDFNTPAVLDIALSVERAVEKLQIMQDDAVRAIAAARSVAPGSLDDEVKDLVRVAGRLAYLQQRTATLSSKLQSFTRAHARALTTTGPSRGYDRRARMADGAPLSLLQSAG